MQEVVAVSAHEAQLNALFNNIRAENIRAENRAQYEPFMGLAAWDSYIEQHDCHEHAKKIARTHLEKMIANNEPFPDRFIALALNYGFYNIAGPKLDGLNSFASPDDYIYQLLKSIAQHDENASYARTLLRNLLNRIAVADYQNKARSMQAENALGYCFIERPVLLTEGSPLPLIDLATEVGRFKGCYPLSVFLKEAGSFNADIAIGILKKISHFSFRKDTVKRFCETAALLVGRSVYGSFENLMQELKMDFMTWQYLGILNQELDASLERAGVAVALLLTKNIPIDVCYIIAGQLDDALHEMPVALWKDQINLGKHQQDQDNFDRWAASKNNGYTIECLVGKTLMYQSRTKSNQVKHDDGNVVLNRRARP